MGAAPSKTSASASDSENEKQRGFADATTFLAALAVPPVSASGSLSLSNIASWEAELATKPKTRLARTILAHSDISTALTTRSALIADTHVFNTQIDFKTGPITSFVLSLNNYADALICIARSVRRALVAAGFSRRPMYSASISCES